MWSHYAEAHFGVCLRFRGTEDEFYGRAEAGRILEIEYGDEVLVKEVGVDTGGEGYLTQASRKAACWEYEQEFRIFQIPSTRKADDAHGNHDFNSDLIDAVYFGVKTPERDKERVQEIIRKSGRQISTFQASRHPDRLDIIFEETET